MSDRAANVTAALLVLLAFVMAAAALVLQGMADGLLPLALLVAASPAIVLG